MNITTLRTTRVSLKATHRTLTAELAHADEPRYHEIGDTLLTIEDAISNIERKLTYEEEMYNARLYQQGVHE